MIERFLRRVLFIRRNSAEPPLTKNLVLPSVPTPAAPFAEDSSKQFPEVADRGLRNILANMNTRCELEIYDWPIRIREFSRGLEPGVALKQIKAEETIRYFASHHLVETSTAPVWYKGQRAYWFTNDQVLAATALYYFRRIGLPMERVAETAKEALGADPLAAQIYPESNAPIVTFQEPEAQKTDPDFPHFMNGAREAFGNVESWPLFRRELAIIISQVSRSMYDRRRFIFNNPFDAFHIHYQLERYAKFGVIVLSKAEYPEWKGRDGKPLQGDVFAKDEVLVSCALIYSWLRMRNTVPLEGIIYKARKLLQDDPIVLLIHDLQREKQIWQKVE
ncbi:MAG: hypothetical protein AAB414_00105 [Patescibacteria group bacterium]|mgnify:CR=1 FL=1